MDLDKNVNSMGMINNREDFKFSDVIRKFQEPTEKHLPLTFTTTYKTSMYAMTSKYISPAKMWDSEPIQGMVQKDAAVEFNFIVRNLVTAWPRKFDALHDFDHETPIKEVLPENTEISKVEVRRSDSIYAKIIRGEVCTFPSVEALEEVGFGWKGIRGFTEKTLIDVKGLRVRKNAASE